MKNPRGGRSGVLLWFSGGRRCPNDRLPLFRLSGLVPVSMMQIGSMRVLEARAEVKQPSQHLRADAGEKQFG
jgi:hypothetical protein